MSEKIELVRGKMFYLPGGKIDTDRIIPARFLKCVTFDNMDAGVFADDRAQANGKHPFDTHQDKGFNILLVDEAFGSGSSREHAPIALKKWGIQAIIGKSFAPIFLGNSINNGIPCVTVSDPLHRMIVDLIRDYPDTALCLKTLGIDIQGNKGWFACKMSSSDQEKLITGQWDDIATCLKAGDAIEKTAASLPYPVH